MVYVSIQYILWQLHKKIVANTKHKKGIDNPNSKKVWQFDLEGNLIEQYPSVADASAKTRIDFRSISKCALGHLKYAGKYVWSYDGTFHYDAHKSYRPRNGTIYQYDMNGNFIKEYNNLDDLRADGFEPQNVMRNAKGTRKSYKGFVFKQGVDK